MPKPILLTLGAGDTFDKIVFDDLRHSATFIAMPADLAAADPVRVSREQRTFARAPGAPATAPGPPAPSAWPRCSEPARSSRQSTR